MQFHKRDKAAIARGERTLSFRRWRRPQAKVGGRYRVGGQVIEVSSVEPIASDAITMADAQAAGCASPQDVLETIRRSQRQTAAADAPLYRIEFRLLGAQPDPRAALAAEDRLEPDELDGITARLAKMDARSRRGAWTRATLDAIAAAPGRRAAELAAAQGCETAKLKADVRKLKALGLTISLEVGYQLSPRGQVVLDALRTESAAGR